MINCTLDYIFQKNKAFKIRKSEQTQKPFLATSVRRFEKVNFIFRDPEFYISVPRFLLMRSTSSLTSGLYGYKVINGRNILKALWLRENTLKSYFIILPLEEKHFFFSILLFNFLLLHSAIRNIFFSDLIFRLKYFLFLEMPPATLFSSGLYGYKLISWRNIEPSTPRI